MIILILCHQKQNGVITSVDDIGTIQVTWENGSTEGLVFDVDEFKTIEGDSNYEFEHNV